MSSSDFLRKNKNQHSVKNLLSRKMDKDIDGIIALLLSSLRKGYPELSFELRKTLTLSQIVSDLSAQHPKLVKEFFSITNRRYIKPDGGFLYATDKKGNTKLILVTEMKRQG